MIPSPVPASEGDSWQRLGELLVELGFINTEQLTVALARQQECGLRLGSVMVDAGFITEARLVRGLSRQLKLDLCDPVTAQVSSQVLALVAREKAFELRVVPIEVRREEGAEVLHLATADPLNTEAKRRIEELTAMPVRWLLAGETEIDLALARHYGTRPPSFLPNDDESEAAHSSAPPVAAPEPASSRPTLEVDRLTPGQPADRHELDQFDVSASVSGETMPDGAPVMALADGDEIEIAPPSPVTGRASSAWTTEEMTVSVHDMPVNMLQAASLPRVALDPEDPADARQISSQSAGALASDALRADDVADGSLEARARAAMMRLVAGAAISEADQTWLLRLFAAVLLEKGVLDAGLLERAVEKIGPPED